MTASNILLYIVLIGYVLFRKVQGQPIKAPKRLLGLPIILIVLGFGDLTGVRTMKPGEIAVITIGAALSLSLGLMRGRADKLFTRDGVPFVRWGKASLALFGANIVAKLVLDIIGVAAGGSASTVEKSLLFTLGLTLLGEAVVLLVRSGDSLTMTDRRSSTGAPVSDARSQFASSRVDGFAPTRPTAAVTGAQDAGDRPLLSGDRSDRGLTSSGSRSSPLGDAIAQHHRDHRERHAQRHIRRHDRHRS